MNRIEIYNDTLKKITVDENIEYQIEANELLVGIKGMKIIVKKNTSLEIFYNSDIPSKYSVNIETLENANLDLCEYRTGEQIKIKYEFSIHENSHINVNKFYDAISVRELVTVNLNGMDATFNYDFKTIAKTHEKYDLVIYHNFKNTESYIRNNGVNVLNGELIFNISGYVENGKTECTINQNSRIINLTNNKCQINPNLFINESNVSANHAAAIGSLNNDEVFYMQSRGIDYQSAVLLLLKGFLKNDAIKSEQIDKIIKKYWR